MSTPLLLLLLLLCTGAGSAHAALLMSTCSAYTLPLRAFGLKLSMMALQR
jgi:hypothetical protein